VLYNENKLLKERTMNQLKKVTSSTKNFVLFHKGTIALSAAVIALVHMNKVALKEHDTFLTEKGLYEEFHAPQA
jgi:hypothetical protein